MTELGCEAVQARMREALLAREAPAAEDVAHASACAACSAHREHLRVLRETLDAETPSLPPDRARAALLRARHELGAPPPAPLARSARALPPSYSAELTRLLLWAVIPLPLVLLWYELLFRIGGALLGEIVPRALLYAIAFASVVGTASWLAVIFGAIPFVAHHRAQRRTRETLHE